MNVSSGEVGAIAADQVLADSNGSNVDGDEEQPINHLVRADDVPGASAFEVLIAQAEKLQERG
jgi:uncharacterized protein (DUF427 family)